MTNDDKDDMCNVGIGATFQFEVAYDFQRETLHMDIFWNKQIKSFSISSGIRNNRCK